MAMLEVRNLTKDYELGKTIVHALRGIDLEIERGEFMTVAGPSGSGKTTLLNIIGCLDAPSSGHVLLEGQDIDELSEAARTRLRREKLGFIFQTFNLIPVLTAFENVELPLLLIRKDPEYRKQRVSKVLGMVGLEEYAGHRPDELSGGQRQRVAIARAIIAHPEIIIADEPTANLDTETGNSIISLMKRINVQENTTFIFSTHDPRMMAHVSRKVDIVDGRIGEYRAGQEQ